MRLRIFIFATELTFGVAKPDEDEEIELKKIHFDDLYKMVIDGEITDSLTVAAALKYKLMLNKLC